MQDTNLGKIMMRTMYKIAMSNNLRQPVPMLASLDSVVSKTRKGLKTTFVKTYPGRTKAKMQWPILIPPDPICCSYSCQGLAQHTL